MKKYKIIWAVENGCVGSGPQYSNIDINEFDEFMDIDNIKEVIYDWVQNDFESKISHNIHSDLDKIAEQIKQELEEK